jgi:hypothetical protein
LHGKKIIATPKKDKIVPILLEAVKFELQVLHSLLLIFYKKSFLGTKVSISS